MSRTPERTCVGCRTKRPKRELVRIVWAADSLAVQLDEGQRMPGRGAYVCREQRCLAAGITKRGLDRTLRIKVPAAARQELSRAFTMGVE
ncbi:MAG TPA: YlxR family protein [Chloroflexota bacterium]|nr:YlxR family protein [Chloroflexota bacterium]